MLLSSVLIKTCDTYGKTCREGDKSHQGTLTSYLPAYLLIYLLTYLLHGADSFLGS